MNDITALMATMKAAAEKAINDEWVKESGDGWEAICSTNDQANGGFIIAHFEGPDAPANREFVQAANPANILALVEALEARDKQIAEMSTICAETYQVVGAFADAAGVFESLEGVSKALDNLSLERLMHTDVIPFAAESRTVTVKLPAEYLNADGSVNADMANTCPVVSAYREAHRAAGIQVIEGEG